MVRGKNVSRAWCLGKPPPASPAAPASAPAAQIRCQERRAERSETRSRAWLRRRPPTDGGPPCRWPTPGPRACLSPSLQLHIDDKQNASGSLKISTDHGNARYSISVSQPPAVGRDCWWNTHTFCAAHCRLVPPQRQSFPDPASMSQLNTTLARLAGPWTVQTSNGPCPAPLFVLLDRSPTRPCAMAM